MAITVKKILKVKPTSGNETRLDAVFVLTDGNISKKCILGDLPNDDQLAKEQILERAEELFELGVDWYETKYNIDCPDKDFLDNLPCLKKTKEVIDKNFETLSEQDRKILKKMVSAIFALKEKLT